MSAPSSSSSSTTTGHRKHSYNHYPSSALLSLFTTIFASSAHAVPAPPPQFLCPNLDQSSYDSSCFLAPRSPQPQEIAPPLTPRHSQQPKRRKRRRKVPDRYVEGDDGRWRKALHYTLYGSTMSVTECQSPTAGVPAVDDEINNSDSSSSSAAGDSAMPTSSIDFMDTLPSGWKPLPHEDRTALILTVSLVLAFFICVFIISCILWRRSLRRMRDIEGRAKKKRKSQREEDMEFMVEKELKSKKKLWARATARWKANARYTARQRKGKRRMFSTTDTTSIISQTRELDDDRLSSRPSLSRRSSTESLTSNPPSAAAVVVSPEDLTIQNQPATPSSPPAYGLSSHHTSDSVTTRGTPKSCGSDRPPSPNSVSNHLSSDEEDDQPSYTPSAHVGHVATDDKRLLERMTLSASAPPQEDGSSHQVSAPVWYDEQLEDFDHSENPGPPSSPAAPDPPYHPLFPPLPTASSSEKGKMREYYDYEYSFGSSLDHDILTAEPEPGPSAPPFESVSVNPELCPSAPPMEFPGDDQLEYIDDQGLVPSAPPAEELSDHGPELPFAQSAVSSHGREQSTSSSVIVQGPMARDGSLPEYHP